MVRVRTEPRARVMTRTLTLIDHDEAARSAGEGANKGQKKQQSEAQGKPSCMGEGLIFDRPGFHSHKQYLDHKQVTSAPAGLFF